MRVAGIIGLLAAALLVGSTPASVAHRLHTVHKFHSGPGYPKPQTSERLPKRLFWSEDRGYASAGRIFETTIGDDGTPTHRELPFGKGVSHIVLSPRFLYWSHYNLNSSALLPYHIGRASLDGSGSYDEKWVTLNSTEYGFSVFNAGMVWMEATQSILYQDEFSYNLMMVSEKTGQPTTLGNFEYQGFGIGGLNGGFWVNGSSTEAIIAIDQDETNNNVCQLGGLLTLSDILTQNSGDAKALLCGMDEPRNVVPFPHSKQVFMSDDRYTWYVNDLAGSQIGVAVNGSAGGGMLSASGKTFVGVSRWTNVFTVVAFYGAGDFNRPNIQVQPWFDIPVNSMNISCVECIMNVHFERELDPRLRQP